MNKLFTMILVGFTVAFFSACSTESTPTTNTPTDTTGNTDTTDNTPAIKITGEWKLEDVEQRNGVTTADDFPFATHTASSDNESGSLTIKDDDQYVFDCTFDQTMEWSLNGSPSTVHNPGMTIDLSGFYIHEAQAETLTLKSGFESLLYAVDELTDNKLIISKQTTHTQYDESLGKTLKTTATEIYTFIR